MARTDVGHSRAEHPFSPAPLRQRGRLLPLPARTAPQARPPTPEPATAPPWEVYARGVRIIALRALNDGSAAADVAQEAVARAMASLAANGAREIGDMGAFIYGIARHLIADARRANARTVDIDSVDEPADAAAGALDAVVAAEEKARMYRAIERLSQRDRDLLRLSFFEGLAVDEIAARLGDNAVNVRQRKSRALARLRRLVLDCHEPG